MIGARMVMGAAGLSIGVSGGMVITAKSVVFDVTDNYGSSYISIRSIEFSKDGVVLPLTASDFTAYATGTLSGYSPDFAFNTSLSKVGSSNTTEWVGAANIRQRLIVVFNAEQDFDEIIVNNGHNSGGSDTRGARTVRITASTDAITDTTFEGAIANASHLGQNLWRAQSSYNAIDDVAVVSLSKAPATSAVTAKSVIFDIADNRSGESSIQVRSIEFLRDGVVLPVIATDFTAYATTSHSVYPPEFAFDTSLSKVGSATGARWITLSGYFTNTRLTVVFNTPQKFDEIVVNNNHHYGSVVDGREARTVCITTSTDAITDTTYDADIANATLLGTSEWPAHAAVDGTDNRTVWQGKADTLPTPSIHEVVRPDGTGWLNQLNGVGGVDYTLGGTILPKKIDNFYGAEYLCSSSSYRAIRYWDLTDTPPTNMTIGGIVGGYHGSTYGGRRQLSFADNYTDVAITDKVCMSLQMNSYRIRLNSLSAGAGYEYAPLFPQLNWTPFIIVIDAVAGTATLYTDGPDTPHIAAEAIYATARYLKIGTGQAGQYSSIWKEIRMYEEVFDSTQRAELYAQLIYNMGMGYK